MVFSSLKLKALLIVPVLSAVFFCIHNSEAQVIFSDIQDSKYKDSIEFLAKRGIVEGYTDGTFRPLQKINRAEILKIILEANPTEEIGAQTGCFRDVQTQWYSKYVCYAKEKGIISGYPDKTFKPAQNVNIAEALKMGIESFPVKITDSGGDWYQKYIDFSHNNNIFSKYSILPQGYMTRGQMAFLIHKLILNKEGTEKFTGKRDSSSPGCGKIPPANPPVSFTVNGLIRHSITVVPSNYNKNTPLSLIFAFHGRTNPNTMVRTYYKVEQASKGQAIMVYPAGLPEEGPSRSWSDSGDKSDQLRDFKFFDTILDDISENYCVDMDEIYVVGHSLGAWFTNSLACARGDVIRAIGSVGGGTTINECTGPVAALIMHNPKDNLASFSSGVEYQECNENAPVIWCPHNDSTEYGGAYYPHTWPDRAGQDIWSFFKSLND